MRTLYFCPVSSFFFFSSPSLSGRRLDGYHTWCGPSANLECRSEMSCRRLAGNARPKKIAKNHHLRTIAQVCRAMSLQLRHVSTIGKKPIKQQYLLHMPSQYGELRSTNGWDRLAGLGHPSKFQRVSRLAFVTAATSFTGGQPNFVRCLAVSWACTLCYTFLGGFCLPTEFCQVQT